MDIKDIYDLLYKGERITLECKLSKSAIPNSIWETYSAFANTYGGIILLGVHEDLEEKDAAKRFVITGVENADKIRKDLWNMLNNTEKVSVNLLKDEDVDEVTIDGKTVVYINYHEPMFPFVLFMSMETLFVVLISATMRGTIICRRLSCA